MVERARLSSNPLVDETASPAPPDRGTRRVDGHASHNSATYRQRNPSTGPVDQQGELVATTHASTRLRGQEGGRSLDVDDVQHRSPAHVAAQLLTDGGSAHARGDPLSPTLLLSHCVPANTSADAAISPHDRDVSGVQDADVDEASFAEHPVVDVLDQLPFRSGVAQYTYCDLYTHARRQASNAVDAQGVGRAGVDSGAVSGVGRPHGGGVRIGEHESDQLSPVAEIESSSARTSSRVEGRALGDLQSAATADSRSTRAVEAEQEDPTGIAGVKKARGTGSSVLKNRCVGLTSTGGPPESCTCHDGRHPPTRARRASESGWCAQARLSNQPGHQSTERSVGATKEHRRSESE